MALGRWEREPVPDSSFTRPFRGVRQRFQSWRESLRISSVACQYLFASQSKILKNVTDEGIDIVAELGRYPLDRTLLQDLLDGQISQLPSQRVKGAQVLTRSIDAVEIVRLPELVPLEYLPKIVGVTSWDILIADILDRGKGNRIFQSCSIDGQKIPLWDERGYAYPPDESFRDPIAQMIPGQDVIIFSSEKRGGISMHITTLPITEDAAMPTFIFATEKRIASKLSWKQTLTEARSRNMAIVFLVKNTQLGIAKAMLWQDLEDEEFPHRIFIQDGRTNHFDFDNTPLGHERSTRDPKEGYLDAIIEFHEGDLEFAYQNYKREIRRRNRSARYEGILATVVCDITETGTSLADNALQQILEIFKCPPVVVTFN